MLALAVGLMQGACADEPESATDDPRVGELGRVRFNGGGCTSSTTMALGSRVTLQFEPIAAVRLPPELELSMSEPAVISGRLSDGQERVELTATAAGESRLSLLLAPTGELFETLQFAAEPATAVRYQSVPRVFVGGRADVVITDVYGGCGSDDCPLIGHSFMSWRSEPSSALALRSDDEGTATFIANAPGASQVFAYEPSADARLVALDIEAVPVDGAGVLTPSARTLPIREGEQARELDFSGGSFHVLAGEAFCIRLDAAHEEGASVPLSRHDVSWSAAGGVRAVAMEHAGEPLGTLFVAGSELATAELSARVPLLDATIAIQILVAPR
jgi:hypothetical protein